VYTARAGIPNLVTEGIMFLGAFVGFAVAFKANEAQIAGYLWLGLLGAVVAGILMGLLMGVFSVTLGVNQHVSGLGITLLCVGLSLFGFRLVFGESSVLPSIDPFAQLSLFDGVPVAESILKQYALTYVAFLVLVPLSWWLLYRTSFGLALRSVGENPEAADAAGIDGRRRGIPFPGAVGGIFARHHRRAGVGVHRAGHLRSLGSDSRCVGRAVVWRCFRPATAAPNAGASTTI